MLYEVITIFIDRLNTGGTLRPGNKTGHEEKSQCQPDEKCHPRTQGDILKQIDAESLMKPI